HTRSKRDWSSDVCSSDLIIWEIGFAINTFLDILPGNHAMNEVFGGTRGCLHWGLGLTPFTQYHIDMICPNTLVLNSNSEVLLGEDRKSVVKGKSVEFRGG